MHSPTSNDACVNIVQSLMFYRKGDESEMAFSKKAIESLVKKLKEKRDELDSLISAITSNGRNPSVCVTIPRTLDGRLQVASRKGFPHVIYSRVWRWPDVHKNELKHVAVCRFAFDLKQDAICVNPYHYERASPAGIDLTGLSGLSLQPFSVASSTEVSVSSPPTLEPKSSPSPAKHPCNNFNLNANNNNNNNNNNDMKSNNINVLSIVNNNNNTLTNISAATSVIDNKNALFNNNIINNNNNNNIATADSLFASTHTSIITSCDDDVKPHLFTIDNGQDGSCMMVTSAPHLSPADTYLSPTQLQQLDLHKPSILTQLPQQQQPLLPQQPQQQQQQPLPQQQQGTQHRQSTTHNNHHDYSHSNDACSTDHPFDDDYLASNAPDETYDDVPETVLFNRPLPEFWCSITYFELDQKVGEICKVPSDVLSITVDGYTNPSSPDRFCLGLLTNVHRTDSIEKARLYIGKGVQLVLRGEGDVWVRCLSEHSIFVQSYYLDREAGRSPGDAVHKIYPAAFIKVFDLNQCRRQMELLVRQARETARSRAANVCNNYHAPEAIGSLAPALSLSTSHSIGADELRRLSVLRLSYVKGWGLDYPRPTIKDTPCWIEVQLYRPLQFLDDFLQSMPAATSQAP